jgi:MFS family permease
LTVAPIYGAMIGLKPAQAGSLIVAFSLGGLCVQPLIGWLSDKFDRRIILGLMAGLSASLCAVIFVTGGPPLWLLLAILFVYGACTLAIYPVALALAFSKVDPALVVSVSGKFLLVYSIGSILAPSISTELMERFQPQAMFVFLGMLAATVACCSVIAILTVADPRAAQKARTSMP